MPPSEGLKGPKLVLLVDAANVVGSRPTGWWRDRPRAARELVERIGSATATGRLTGPVVVVLEGQARRGAPEGELDGVRVVHALASGDDTLVALAAEAVDPIVVISADRELRRRAESYGAEIVGPSWLLERLDD